MSLHKPSNKSLPKPHHHPGYILFFGSPIMVDVTHIVSEVSNTSSFANTTAKSTSLTCASSNNGNDNLLIPVLSSIFDFADAHKVFVSRDPSSSSYGKRTLSSLGPFVSVSPNFWVFEIGIDSMIQPSVLFRHLLHDQVTSFLFNPITFCSFRISTVRFYFHSPIFSIDAAACADLFRVVFSQSLLTYLLPSSSDFVTRFLHLLNFNAKGRVLDGPNSIGCSFGPYGFWLTFGPKGLRFSIGPIDYWLPNGSNLMGLCEPFSEGIIGTVPFDFSDGLESFNNNQKHEARIGLISEHEPDPPDEPPDYQKNLNPERKGHLILVDPVRDLDSIESNGALEVQGEETFHDTDLFWNGLELTNHVGIKTIDVDSMEAQEEDIFHDAEGRFNSDTPTMENEEIRRVVDVKTRPDGKRKSFFLTDVDNEAVDPRAKKLKSDPDRPEQKSDDEFLQFLPNPSDDTGNFSLTSLATKGLE